MNKNEYIFLPADLRLTALGVRSEITKGNNIVVSKYKILDIYWDEVYYPYPHSTKRLKLKKFNGTVVHDKYVHTVQDIISELNLMPHNKNNQPCKQHSDQE